jgi:Yip1 domain
MNIFADRLIRAARLDAQLYEEVEADKQTMGQAMGAVVLSSVAAGIGAPAAMGVGGIVLGAIGALVGWFVWAFLTYFIGTRFLPEPQTKADLGELLRTIGFSSSPGLIRVVGIIHPIAGIVYLLAGIWMLVAMVVAVRQALDYTSTGRAIGVCAIGFVVQVVFLALLFTLMGGSGT